MTLQLKVGKYYKNRKGEKVLINKYDEITDTPYVYDSINNGRFLKDGRYWESTESEDDLIEEWKDEESGLGPEYRTFEETSAAPKETLAINDPVNYPKHYTSHPSGIECIDITKHMSFTLGNAFKYIWRADLKNGIEDLEKAIWYLQTEVDKRKGDR